jgi:hypothetical protein
MSGTIACEFCAAEFQTKGNLKRHQAKTVYCLEIQHSDKSRKEIKETFETFSCGFCQKELSTKQKLNLHLKICSSKNAVERVREELSERQMVVDEQRVEIITLKTRLEDRDIQIVDLKAQISELQRNQQAITMTAITRPTTNVKNTIKNLQVNNLTPLLPEEMRSHIPMLTHDHIRAGAVGLAQYALEYPLKNKVLVADASRRKLKWKNETGTIVEDLEGVELCRKFFEVHKDDSRVKISELMKEVMERHDAAQDMDDEEEIKHCDELICKLHDLRRGISRLVRGEPDELRSGFVKEICVKLVPDPVVSA